MKKNRITKEALGGLSRIFVSCRPLMGEIITPNQFYLISKAREKQDIYFSDFTRHLPVPDPTYGQILRFANRQGKNVIDEQVIWEFFGGYPHFLKIKKQIKKLKLKKDFAKRIFLAHMLIVVRITKIKGGIEGVYRNRNIEVKVKNLVSTLKDAKLKKNQKILAHYASIVSDKVSADLEKKLKQEQAEENYFLEACRYVKEIDYKDFWDLYRWSKKIIKERKL